MNNFKKMSQSQQLWILALSAVLSEHNGYDHHTLYGREKTDELVQLHKQGLKRDWNISNKKDFMRSYNWLLEDGHGVDFLNIRDFLSTLSEEGQNNYIKSLSKDSDRSIAFHLVKIYDKKLPKGGILSWDYGRCINLCRTAAYVGYISDTEAWELMLKVAKLAQNTYSSWREYGLAYIAGRQFWLKKLTKESADDQFEMIRELMFDKESPWWRLDWNINLE